MYLQKYIYIYINLYLPNSTVRKKTLCCKHGLPFTESEGWHWGQNQEPRGKSWELWWITSRRQSPSQGIDNICPVELQIFYGSVFLWPPISPSIEQDCLSWLCQASTTLVCWVCVLQTACLFGSQIFILRTALELYIRNCTEETHPPLGLV